MKKTPEDIYYLVSDFRDSIIELYNSNTVDSKAKSIIELVAIDLADLLYTMTEQDV